MMIFALIYWVRTLQLKHSLGRNKNAALPSRIVIIIWSFLKQIKELVALRGSRKYSSTYALITIEWQIFTFIVTSLHTHAFAESTRISITPPLIVQLLLLHISSTFNHFYKDILAIAERLINLHWFIAHWLVVYLKIFPIPIGLHYVYFVFTFCSIL